MSVLLKGLLINAYIPHLADLILSSSPTNAVQAIIGGGFYFNSE
jgi:hypothetical protein